MHVKTVPYASPDFRRPPRGWQPSGHGPDEPHEGPHQLRRLRLQLGERVRGQSPQYTLARRAQGDDHCSTIWTAAPALDHASLLQPIDELAHRVVPDLQPGGQRTDGGLRTALEALDLEQYEVLLGLHPRGAGRQLAGPEKSSDLAAQVGEGLIVDGRSAAAGRRSRAARRGRHGADLYITE